MKNKLNILIATDAWEPQTNGVVTTLKNLGLNLQEKKHKVSFLTPKEFITIPCPTYPEIRLSINVFQKYLKKKFHQINPDVIHIATEGPIGFAVRRYCVKNKILFTSSYHTKFPEYIFERFKLKIILKLSKKFMAYFHSKSYRVFVTTETMKKDLANKGFKKDKMVVWTRGVNRNIFNNKGNIKKLNYKKPIWIYVGRIAVEKNIEKFLELKLPGTKLLIGDGPQLKTLKEKYREANFLGNKNHSQVAEYLGQSDVFVFPSLTDTFGVVLIEALSMGVPIAAYPVPGPIDIIKDKKIFTLNKDLLTSCKRAQNIKKIDCINAVKGYTWENCAAIFLKNIFVNKK